MSGSLLLGNYTLEQRDDYVNRKALEYLQRHPNVTVRYAKRQARLRWRGKLNK